MARRDLGSASARERNEECRASSVLDTVESSSPDADAGRAVHAFLYGVNTFGRTKALALVPAQYRAICEVMDPADYPTDPKAFAAELAFAYHVEKGTARVLGQNIERHYVEHGLVLGEEIPGSPDVVALVGEDAVYVGDFKRGGRHTPPAKRNHQLRFLALAACRAYGRDRAIVEIIRIFAGETTPWRDRTELDAFDLDDYAVTLRRFRERVLQDRAAHEQSGTLPRASMGDWCRFCPCFARCEAQTGLMRRAVSGEIVATKPLTVEQASEAFVVWRRVEALAKELERECKGFAREIPIPTKDGKVYTFVPAEGEEYDLEKAEPVLAKVLGEKPAALVLKKYLTQDSLKDGVRAFLREHPEQGGFKGELTHHVEKLKAELIEQGGLALVPGGKMGETKPAALAKKLAAAPKLRALPAPAPEPAASAAPGTEERPAPQPAAVPATPAPKPCAFCEGKGDVLGCPECGLLAETPEPDPVPAVAPVKRDSGRVTVDAAPAPASARTVDVMPPREETALLPKPRTTAPALPGFEDISFDFNG